ncbi:MAG: alkaline phosphatase family protein [Planctomycetota bacterium]|jgi:arylsulfatase A-like enzyme
MLLLRSGSALLLAIAASTPILAESNGSPGTSADDPSRLVVLITLDGARPDGIVEADTPNLDALVARGAAAADARATYPFLTLPVHVAMLSGQRFYQHQVMLNHNVEPMPPISVPTVLDICAEHGVPTLMLIGKRKLRMLQPRSGGPPRCRQVRLAQIGEALLEETRAIMPSFVLIHSAQPDVAGHANGWMSPAYLKAISRADRMVGQVVEWLRSAGKWERTLIIITADHGGFAKTHRGEHPADVAIPWIVSGGLARRAELPDRVHICDTAPTILRMLGLPVPSNLDGAAVEGLRTYPVSSR